MIDNHKKTLKEIKDIRRKLEKRLTTKGTYENFGQKELGKLEEKYQVVFYGWMDKDEEEITREYLSLQNFVMNN